MPLSSTLPTPEARTVTIGRPLRIFAWLSFLAEVIIIATGGAVRLTGSGLGCSEWPLCTPESLVPVLEVQGLHGAIEFGNRMMTGVVGILALGVLFLTLHAVGGRAAMLRATWFAVAGVVVAILAFLGAAPFTDIPFAFASGALLLAVALAAVDSLRAYPVRRDLSALAWIVLAGVMVQAVVGGIAVLTELNAFVVGFHYVSSLVLVCATAAFLVRVNDSAGLRALAIPRWYALLAHVTGLVLTVTIFFGVLTTGNGPHSGDANVRRDGFDATILAHVHSWPGYLLAALLLALVVTAWMLRLAVRRWTLALAAVVIVQIIVGVIQARDGLPPVLVGVHMVLAALSAAAYTVVVLRLSRPETPRQSGRW